MPRRNRNYTPATTWHLTHRCHNREFHLKFRRDRERYRYWIAEAVSRYGLCVINFNLTSNHAHLIVHEGDGGDGIKRSMQLIAGRVAQEYNLRKGRLGAYWQDRYHATAVQTGVHLRRCMTYVDMNMVRAGVVNHPREWPDCGFHDIQNRRMRRPLLNLEHACGSLGFANVSELAAWQEEAIDRALLGDLQRKAFWTESVAVGECEYLESLRHHMGFLARYRNVSEVDEGFILHDEPTGYLTNCPQKWPIKPE